MGLDKPCMHHLLCLPPLQLGDMYDSTALKGFASRLDVLNGATISGVAGAPSAAGVAPPAGSTMRLPCIVRQSGPEPLPGGVVTDLCGCPHHVSDVHVLTSHIWHVDQMSLAVKPVLVALKLHHTLSPDP
jgi:hypothetical protein